MGCNSCASHRLAELAVGLAIVLLVALLVVLWTGSTGGVGHEKKNLTEAAKNQGIFAGDLLRARDGNESECNFKFFFICFFVYFSRIYYIPVELYELVIYTR